MNNKFVNACNRVNQKTPPIWMMRQAGRYHSHYQELKKSYTFEQLCKTPELAAEVARGPVAEFDFDLAILFSDILFVFEALGLPLKFDPGPKFEHKITEQWMPEAFNLEKAIDFMQFQKQAMQATREALPKDKSLIGFVGGPWSLLNFGLDSSCSLKFRKEFLNSVMVPLLKANIQLQLDGGAEKVMILDSGLANIPGWFLETEYGDIIKKLVGPNIGYYCRGFLGEKAKFVLNKGWDGVGIDASLSLRYTMKTYNKGFVQGNFNESMLLLPKKQYVHALDKFCNDMQDKNLTGWICGLGHGINKLTPEKHVHHFIDTIRRRFN